MTKQYFYISVHRLTQIGTNITSLESHGLSSVCNRTQIGLIQLINQILGLIPKFNMKPDDSVETASCCLTSVRRYTQIITNYHLVERS